MLKGLKNFLLAGNIMDLAVGLVMGAAFEKVVHSFVGRGIMPLVSLLLPGDLNLEDQKIVLRSGTHAVEGAAAEGGAHTVQGAVHSSEGVATSALHSAGGESMGMIHGGQEIAFGWGDIIQNIIEFALIGAAIYFVLLALGRKPVPPELKKTDELLAEIRDLMEHQVAAARANPNNPAH